MQTITRDERTHSHDFAPDQGRAEKNTRKVLILTAAMMVVEIVAGGLFRSMALLADGWHMATHVGAFAITIFAYRYARRHADDPRFAFGTGKVGVLGGFASATALAVVALVMALESIQRLLDPKAIRFDEAIAVAALGLLVNVISGVILQESHEHEGEEHHHDHNLRAAYFHVLADALTSLLAIVALLAGKYFGWSWLDPMMGFVGAGLITRWAYGLMRDTSAILLDAMPDGTTEAAVRTAIEADGAGRVTDIHVWHVGPHHVSAALCVESDRPEAPEHYRRLLAGIPRLCHVVVEVSRR